MLSTSSGFASSSFKNDYAKLKKELLFHEKRMQLLLTSRIVEDIGHSLKEKTEARNFCAEDCKVALRGFEEGAAELNLSGKWSEVRIASMFGLEVPLPAVVGSDRFEAAGGSGGGGGAFTSNPIASGSAGSTNGTNSITDIADLLLRVEEMGKRITEFRSPSSPAGVDAMGGLGSSVREGEEADQDTNAFNEEERRNGKGMAEDEKQSTASLKVAADKTQSDVETFIKNAKKVFWTPSDLRRISEAIASKHTVLKELASLGSALRDAQYSASCERIKLEELRKADERANRDGEVATEETVVHERLESLERLIDVLLFMAHTIESSIDSNVKKRRNNMSAFMNGAAVVQCIVKEKENVIKACDNDVRKIDRCVQYEGAHNGYEDMRTKISESSGSIAKLGEKQAALQRRLQEIYKEWDETEQALEKVAQQRSQAISSHVELLDSARHAQSDFMEMCKFADKYKENLGVTRDESAKAIEQLKLLERVLLQQQTFETYDFRATARRLATMHRRVAFDLNRSVNEHQRCAEQLLRRLDAQSRALSEAIDLHECEAEIRRDTLDPATKKYVEKARELSRQRDKIEEESRQLAERVMAEHTHCMDRIREVLPDEDIVDESEKVSDEMMGRHEELLDLRQTLVTPPEMSILDERLRVAREKQSTLAAVLQDTTRRSRILAIRNDIGRTRGGEGGGYSGADAEDEEASEVSTTNKEVGERVGGGGVVPSSTPAAAAMELALNHLRTTKVVSSSSSPLPPAAANSVDYGNNSISNQNDTSPPSVTTTLLVGKAGRVLPGGTRGVFVGAAAPATLVDTNTTANSTSMRTAAANGGIVNAANNRSAESFSGVGGGVASPLIASKAGGVLVSGVTGAISSANAALLAAEREAEREVERQKLSARANHNHGLINTSTNTNNKSHHLRTAAADFNGVASAAAAADTTVESIDVSAIGEPASGHTATREGVRSSSSTAVQKGAAFEFDPNPKKITTAAALREEALEEERLIEQERLARLHERKVDIFSLGRGMKRGGADESKGGVLFGGEGDVSASSMGARVPEEDASHRALVMRYRDNEERAHKIRGKARAIADVSASDISLNLNESGGK